MENFDPCAQKAEELGLDSGRSPSQKDHKLGTTCVQRDPLHSSLPFPTHAASYETSSLGARGCSERWAASKEEADLRRMKCDLSVVLYQPQKVSSREG